MSKLRLLILAIAVATACGAACSKNSGAEATGGGSVQLPSCQLWPEAQGPALSFPLRWPSTFDSVRRAANGKTLYAVGRWTNGGLAQRTLIRSTDDGQTWCPLSMPGSPVSVVPAPADDLTLWAITESTAPGLPAQGILSSADGGASWRTTRGDLPSAVHPQTILSVGAGRGDVAWIATDEGMVGAASTRDGGRTWTRITLTPPAAPLLGTNGPMAIDPARPNRILVAQSNLDPATGTWSQRLLRSVDWGVTWSDIPLPPLPSRSPPLEALTIDQASTTFAMEFGDTDQQMWRLMDGGTSWRAVALPAGATMPFLVHGGMPGHLLILSVDVSPAHLWESLDSGDSWHEMALPDGFNQRKGSALLVAGPAPGQLLVSTPIGLQATSGAASPWIARALLPASVSAIAVSPADPEVIWAVTPAQSLRSADGGRTWKALGALRFADIAADPGDARSAFAVDQTTAYRTTDGGESWRPLAPNRHQPRHLAVAADGKVLYVVTSAGIECSEDQGATWSHVLDVDVLPAVGLQIAISPSDGRHAVVLAALRSGSNSAFMIETRDAGATVTSTSTIPGLAGQLQFTSIALVGNDVILVGGQSGVLRSTDGGASWAESNQGFDPGVGQGLPCAPRALPVEPIWSILAPPASPAEVWVLTGWVFRSLDRGTHWTPWPAPACTPASLSLSVIVGDPRPGRRLLALTTSQESTGAAGDRPNTSGGMTVLELRP
jgi:photosystem II stability/assembly factor-like uncharacterized protein